MLQVDVESESGPFGDMPKRFRLDGREVEIAENIDRWHGEGYSYFKVKGDDGNLYILRLDEQIGWELTMFQSPQSEAFATQSPPRKSRPTMDGPS
jgi:hypothetical protein